MNEQLLLSNPEGMGNDVEKNTQQSTNNSPEREKSESVGHDQESDRILDSNTNMPTGTEMIVDFDGKDDPYRPMNWPLRKKVITTVLYGFTTCWITFASAIYSAGVRQIAHDCHVSMEVSTTGTSMVVFGFALGPLVWAPLSEMYGRKVAVLAVSAPFLSDPCPLGLPELSIIPCWPFSFSQTRVSVLLVYT